MDEWVMEGKKEKYIYMQTFAGWLSPRGQWCHLLFIIGCLGVLVLSSA